MKATNSFQELRAYVAFFLLVLVMISCGPDNNILPDPPDPPVTYTKSAVAIKPAEKITMTSATVVAKIVPNENDTKVSFEYKTAESSWTVKDLPLTFSGKDSVAVTFDLSDLKSGTEYSFRVKANNVAGEVISSESKFATYAVADFDGNLYHTITIGTQTWLQENFKGTHYANGDAIANVTNATTWAELTTGAYCWYNNDSKLGKIYGGLYNFYVGTDSRGLILGWHVSTYEEWEALITYLDGNIPANYGSGVIACPKVMEVGNSHWQTTHVPATNTSGFTALPNGGFSANPGVTYYFQSLGTDAMWWSSTSIFGGVVAGIDKNYCILNAATYEKSFGFGLRLTKN